MDQRRKRVSLTIFQKVEILKKLQHGSSVKMIQEEYNVGKSTIYDLGSDKEKILQYAAECESANLMKNIKTMKPAKFEELDRVLYEWFKQRRSEGIPISGFILREKATEFHQTMALEELLLYYNYYYIWGKIRLSGKFDYPDWSWSRGVRITELLLYIYRLYIQGETSSKRNKQTLQSRV